MTTTYRGVKIKVKALRGTGWGYCEVSINGVSQGREMGSDEQKLTDRQHGYIDMAIAEPDRFPECWQPKH